MPSPNSKERLNKKWLKTGMMISWILSTDPNDSWQLKVMRQRVWTKKSLQCVTLWSHRAMLGGLTKILKLHMFTKYTGYLYQWWLASNRCLSSVGGWKWVIWGERGIGGGYSLRDSAGCIMWWAGLRAGSIFSRTRKLIALRLVSNINSICP